MPNLSSLFQDKNQLLLKATRDGNRCKALRLIKNGADINSKGEDGWTPLHYASHNGQAELVEILLTKGANVDAASGHNLLTPLYEACQVGHIEIVKMILKGGGNTEAMTSFGYTPLRNACEQGNLKLVNLLLKSGANTETPGKDGVVVLHRACCYRSPEVAKLLISNGANIESKSNDGRTPLHYACDNKSVEAVKLLLAKGANTEAKDYFEENTPLHKACSKGCVEIVRMLLAKGTDVEATNDKGSTALHCACSDKDVPVVIAEMLLENGASAGVKDKDGKTPLDLAKSIRHGSVAKLVAANHTHQSNQNHKSSEHTYEVQSASEKLLPSLSHKNKQNSPASIGHIRSHLNAMIKGRVTMDPIQLPQAYIQEIKTNKRLGGGFFGEVHLGEDKVIGMKFAIKLINPLVIDEAFASRIGSIQKTFRTEIRVLSQLQHPNIAPLYGYCMEGENLQNTCLVYELASNGSLDKFWEDELGRSRLSDEKARTRIALEVASALRYMHEGLDGGDACFHRDIKSGNICLAADLSSRIIDCGLSKYVTESDSSVSSAGASGTPGYICPLYSQGIASYCSACDVFSFGVLLCELITGKTNSRQTPHYATYKLKKEDLVDDADECVYWGKGSRLETLSRLALECMELELSSRPSIGDLVEELGNILYHNKHHQKEDTISHNATQQALMKCRSCGLNSSTNTIIGCFGSQKHYHCHNCFENHVKKNINSFDYKLTCPKEGCDSRLFLDTEVANIISANVWNLYLNQSKMVGLVKKLEKTLTSKVESECRQVKDLTVQLCAGNGLPCPRRFVLIAANRHGKLLSNPREWAKNLKSIKLYIYFVCSHSNEIVSDSARIKVRYTPGWLEKIAPALNASLSLIQISLNTYSGGNLSLDMLKIQELDEWSKELMDPADRKIIQCSSISGDDAAVRELNYKSLSYVAEKTETNRNWLNELVPVFDSKYNEPTFVLEKYASLPRYGGESLEI